MKKFSIRVWMVVLLICLAPVMVMAVVAPAPVGSAAWQIVPEDSSITFVAIQNNAPVTGEFKTFTGDIHFDPTRLDTSNVRIVVDMNSVTLSYKEALDTIKNADWFNVKLFPQAIFKADHFTKINGNTYEADGTLTIRDKTSPVKLTFVLDEYTKTKAHISGSTVVKRTVFGIGQGEWAKTDSVKDDVEVKFTLTGIKK